MRKKFCFILLFVLLLSFCPIPRAQAAVQYDGSLRVGLYYGASALASANLQNVTDYGSGYQFGWFDDSGTFSALGYLSNVYLTIYPDTTYHLQTGLFFSTYDEARSYADMMGIDAFPSFVSGGFTVFVGNYSSYFDAQDAAFFSGYAVAEASPTGYTVCDTQSGEILLEFDLGGTRLAIQPVMDQFSGNDGAQTWFKGRKYYGAFEYSRDGGGVAVINGVNMEDYIRGVIPYEMSGSWPLEALKAQAICARTYAYANLGKHKADGFDLCNTTDCQVYYGTGSANERTDQAVLETAGMYLTYAGELITAYYYSSNGGASEDSENVWNEALPYLRAVRDEFEQQTNVSHTDWTYEITLADITDILRERGNEFTGSIVHAYATYTDAGNMKSLTFIDSAGQEIVYTGERCRSLFNVSGYNIHVYSQRFIFEDKYAMRIESNAEITNVGAGSVSAPSGGVYGSADIASSSVLTGNGTVSGANQYGVSAPVLSSSGTDDADTVTTISGASGFHLSSSGNGTVTGTVSADSLPIPESCSGTFIIRGSGNGHNVGLSQYGAKAMAELGYTYTQILTYYYTGVTISVAF